MKIGWLDSHAHLVIDELFEDFEVLRENAIKSGIDKICIICSSLNEFDRAISVIGNDDLFDLALGIHPSSANKISEAELDALMMNLNHPRVGFVGEIGLDFYWDQSFNEQQLHFFIKQIEYANEYHKPIIIHMRSSSDETYEVLKDHPVAMRGIAHCFTESVDSAQRFVDLGYLLGVGGIVTFKNGQNIKDLVEHFDLSVLLTETDSPYLAPQPNRGKRNEPSYVSYIGSTIAKIKGISEDDVKKQVRTNYESLIKRGKYESNH